MVETGLEFGKEGFTRHKAKRFTRRPRWRAASTRTRTTWTASCKLRKHTNKIAGSATAPAAAAQRAGTAAQGGSAKQDGGAGAGAGGGGRGAGHNAPRRAARPPSLTCRRAPRKVADEAGRRRHPRSDGGRRTMPAAAAQKLAKIENTLRCVLRDTEQTSR